MLLAQTDDYRAIRASPGGNASCPECGQPVLAKCGQVLVWHWAHHAGSAHCPHSGGETAWHLNWKAWAHDHGCQVEKAVVEGFRADIVTPSGGIVELQSKALDPEQVAAREFAYGQRLIWICLVKEDEPGERLRLGGQLNNGGRGFWWRRGPKRLTFHKKPVYLDTDETAIDDATLWQVKKIDLVDRETQWGTSKRMTGWAMPVNAHQVFHIERLHREPKWAFCSKHHSHFCPCAYPRLYENDHAGAAAWG